VPKAGTQPFDFEIAGVQQEAGDRLFVVRIATDVGHHHQSRLRLGRISCIVRRQISAD